MIRDERQYFHTWKEGKFTIKIKYILDTDYNDKRVLDVLEQTVTELK